MEEWRDIKGYEGRYQVSSEGRVKSLERYALHGSGNALRIVRAKFLKLTTNSDGYRNVKLYRGGKNKSFKVHQLVAIAFLDHIPNGYKIVCDHIDNNPLNNNVENLQLITHRENTSKDQWRQKRSSSYIGVTWDKKKKKWLSQIAINNKPKFLGYFTDELEASNEYQKVLSVVNSKSNEYINKYIKDNYTRNYSSKHKGISWDKAQKKWRASITIDGRSKYLGRFKSEIDATQAYKNALALV